MTLPTPDDFDRDVKRLVQELGWLANEYRWGHGMAFDGQVMEQARVPARGTTNPTKAVAFDHGNLRGRLADAVKEVRDSHRAVKQRRRNVEGAIELDERRHGPMFDPLRNPRTASRSDLADARAAQRRRRERGEAIPG